MHDCRKIQEQLIDLVFGELNDAQQAQVFAELEACQPCRAEYQSFKATLSTFDKTADLMLPGEEYWNSYEARLRTKLAETAPPSLWQRLVDFAKATQLRPAWGGSIFALLLTAFLLWILFKQPTPVEQSNVDPGQTPPIAQSSEPSKPGIGSPAGEKSGTQKTSSVKNNSPSKRKFAQPATTHPDHQADGQRQTRQPEFSPEVATSEYDYLVRSLADNETVKHFEKAQNLLRSFRNLSSKTAASAGEIADEKNRSRSLLLRNVLLRREAETRGNLPVEQVLSALEPLLIDIAHLPDRASRSEMRAIHERIQRKEMIGKLQVYAARPLIAETTIE